MRFILLCSFLFSFLFQTFSQRELTADEYIKELGETRIMELFYTEQLGELLSSGVDVQLCAKKSIKGQAMVYDFGNFVFFILPHTITVLSTESAKIKITTKYLSTDKDGNELKNGDLVIKAINCLTKKAPKKQNDLKNTKIYKFI